MIVISPYRIAHRKPERRTYYPSRRGNYDKICPYTIARVSSDAELPFENATTCKIAMAEFSTMVFKEPDILGLYENDEELLEKYLKPDYLAFVKQCKETPYSKNNVLYAEGCCLNYYHYVDGLLTVVSRSLDWTRAKYTDVLIAKYFANMIGAKFYTVIFLNPHVYEDTSKIARRS